MPAQPLGVSSLLGMGLAVAVQLAVGLALGLLIDHLTGSAPLFLFLGLALGLTACIGYAVVRFRAALSPGTTDRPE